MFVMNRFTQNATMQASYDTEYSRLYDYMVMLRVLRNL